MPADILEKRTSEAINYDIDCSALLLSNETISSITSVDADETGLTFGTPTVNVSQINYGNGIIAAIGKVIQVRVSAGTIPAGESFRLYTIRAKFATSASNTREATVLLNVKNSPI